MAMRFSQAGRAENPDMAQALAMQNKIANDLRAAEMQRDAQMQASMMQGGVDLAVAAPEGTFTDGWDSMNSGMDGNTVPTAPVTDPMSDGQMSGLTEASAGVDPFTGESLAAPEMSSVFNPSSGAGADALLAGGEAEALAGASDALAASEVAAGAGAGANAAAASGLGAGGSGALASMGPMGWAALAGLSLPVIQNMFS